MLRPGKHGKIFVPTAVFHGKKDFPKVLLTGAYGIVGHIQHEGNAGVGKAGEEEIQQLKISFINPNITVAKSMTIFSDTGHDSVMGTVQGALNIRDKVLVITKRTQFFPEFGNNIFLESLSMLYFTKDDRLVRPRQIRVGQLRHGFDSVLDQFGYDSMGAGLSLPHLLQFLFQCFHLRHMSDNLFPPSFQGNQGNSDNAQKNDGRQQENDTLIFAFGIFSLVLLLEISLHGMRD